MGVTVAVIVAVIMATEDWELLSEGSAAAVPAPVRWSRWECLACETRQVGQGDLSFEEHCATDEHKTRELQRLLYLHQAALFTQRGGLEVNFESGGSAEDHVKAVPGTKIKSKMIMTNVSDDPVMLEHMDTLFHVEGLSFDATRVLPFIFPPGYRREIGIQFTPPSIGVTEAVFVFRCRDSATETTDTSVFAAKWHCQTVHPKYKQELQQLMSGELYRRVKTPGKKPTPRRSQSLKEKRLAKREEDLESLNRIVFNEDSGFKVPGQYRRLASFVDETDVRFEMLEGLVHPGVTMQGLASRSYRDRRATELENYNEYWHRVLWMDEVLQEKGVRRHDLRLVHMEECGREGANVTVRVPFPSSDEDAAGNHPLKGVERAAVEAAGDGMTAMAEVTSLGEDHILLRMKQSAMEIEEGERYNVRFVLSRRVLERLHEAIHFSTHDKRGMELLKRWFLHRTGGEVASRLKPSAVPSDDLEILGQTELNQRQRLAVKCALEFSGPGVPAIANHPYVVFGPPGTGKTTVLTEYILQVLRWAKVTGTSSRVLVTAPSNWAADNIASKLLESMHGGKADGGGGLLRANAASRDPNGVPEDVLGISILSPDGKKFRRPNWNEITGAKVLVTTCMNGANLRKKYGNLCLQHGTFTHCVVDEAGQATEPETLCSVMGLLTRESALVLGGDPQQLRPVVLTSFGGRKDGLGLTLLERLIDKEIAPLSPFAVDSQGNANAEYTSMLTENYRSHESIIRIPNEKLYFGKLEAKGPQRVLQLDRSQSKKCAVVWHSLVGSERRDKGGSSFYNAYECVQVLDYCVKIHSEKNVPQEEIGVITPYKRQMLKIKKLLASKGLGEIEVGTVELFQGREKRAIVASCVRSKPYYLDFKTQRDLGFLTDFRRWNVTVTRAKELLVVVANPETMGQDPYYRALLTLCGISGNCFGWRPKVETRGTIGQQQLLLLKQLKKVGLGSPGEIHLNVLGLDRERVMGAKAQRAAAPVIANLSPANMVCVCSKKWVEPPKNSVMKSFGGMHNFMASHGLKPTPDGYKEGNALADAFIALDRDNFIREHQNCHLAQNLESEESWVI